MYNMIIDKRVMMSILAVMFSVGLYAQRLALTGTVMNEMDTPLKGATVTIIGQQERTSTDDNGTFSLRVNRGQNVLISYVGYADQMIRVAGQNNIVVRLVPEASTLEEVIVVGYGEVKRGDLTGSVASVGAKDVEDFRTSSVLGALGGQVAGVQITQADGEPGSDFSVNIRGVGTLTGDASPLYIVDGFEVDDLDFLANTDIETIDVLKDASASAIYGARAANGVVLVTTKQGKIGSPRITYTGATSHREIYHQLELLSPYEFVKLQADINVLYPPIYYREGEDDDGVSFKYQSAEDYINVPGINWQTETFRPTWSQDHNVTVNGGVDNTRYNFSLNRYNEDGIFNNTGFNRTTANMRINQKLTSSVTLDARVNYAMVDRIGTGTTDDGGSFNMLAQILSARPTGGLRIDDQTLLESAIDPEMLEEPSLSQVNPIKQTESVINDRRRELWSTNLSVIWQIRKGLSFRSAGTYNTTNFRNDIFYKQDSRQAYRNGQMPYGQTQMGKNVRWVNYNNLTWKQRIDEKNSYDVMIGQEASFRSAEYLLGQAMDFPFDNLGNNNLGVGATPSRVTTDFSDKKLLSFFTRANYNYDNRYLLTATMRADGSTVFSPKNKWGYFPSFAVAWRISEESFLKDVTAVSDLKLRTGWGVVGNDRIPSYLSLDLYEMSRYGIGNTTHTVLNPRHLRNQNLKWEGSSTINLGLDWGFFNNRLTMVTDFFVKDTRDLLLAQSLAHVTGFDSQYQNIGKIRNKGFEWTVVGKPIQKKNFSWESSFNISFLRNELRALQDGADAMFSRSGFGGSFTEYDYVAYVGQSLGLMYGYEFDGVYQYSDFNTTPDGQLILKNGVTNNTRLSDIEPGMVKYKDQNGDGIITPDDRAVIGNAIPKGYGGFTNTFQYKGIDLSFLVQFNYGNDIYNATRLYATQSRVGRRNMLAEVADRWTPTNASNKVPSTNGYVVYDIYSRFIEDGSFLRLKNVSIGYNLPTEWIRKAKLSRARIYAVGQNLWTLTGYSGFDPEVSVNTRNPMMPGLDWGAYPRSKVFTFGLEIQL